MSLLLTSGSERARGSGSQTTATSSVVPEEQRRCPEIHHSQLPAQAEGVALHEGLPPGLSTPAPSTISYLPYLPCIPDKICLTSFHRAWPWTPGSVGVVSSTLWTGKDTDLMKDLWYIRMVHQNVSNGVGGGEMLSLSMAVSLSNANYSGGKELSVSVNKPVNKPI